MRILHVVQSLDPAWGGIARVLPELAAGLAAAGDSCRIATLAGGRYGTPPAVPGVELSAFTAASKSRLGRSSHFDRDIAALVAEADVVHLHGLWTSQNWSAGRAARGESKPYIMTPHSMMMPWAWNRSWWKKRPIGWLFEHGNLKRAALLHALSDGEASAIRALGFNSQIETIPNGLHVDEYERLPSAEAIMERFPETRDRRWLLFLGRIHPQKGVVEALQGAFDVAASVKDWHFIVGGPDEVGLVKLLKTAAARKGLSDRVTFTGMLGRQDVLACLGRATLLLQPSRSEGLSMSILEALAAGVPVVISPACNMPEVERADAGRIVDPHRGSIAATLKQLITMSSDALAAIGQRGRSLARERFDWPKLVPQYRKMYQNAAGI
jgi:glycosyltransferase involved in cell wall biosynthesis